MKLNIKQVAEDMFLMVERDKGSKKYKPSDLFKEMTRKYEAQGITKKDCKQAIRSLVDSGRLVYTYYGGSWVEIPSIEGSARQAYDLQKKQLKA
jgi:hypothetical protein